MAQKSGDAIKGGDVFRALIDLVILALLVCGSAFGGYWYGVHERLAPVQNVPPGTPGALPATAVTPGSTGAVTMPTPSAPTTPLTMPTAPSTSSTPTTTSTTSTTSTTETNTKPSSKYWLASSGVDYMGYSITVSVNDNPVDSFYGPGKTFDITRFVKPGDNTVQFEAKALGDQFNKHKRDSKAELKVQVVSGPKITDEFKPADVVLSYIRKATESEDFNNTLNFKVGN